MRIIKIYIFIACIFFFILTVKMTKKGFQKKIYKKFVRPLGEIQELFEAIKDVNSSIQNYS